MYTNILKEDPENRIAKANIDLVETRIKEEAAAEKKRKEQEKEAALRKAKVQYLNITYETI